MPSALHTGVRCLVDDRYGKPVARIDPSASEMTKKPESSTRASGVGPRNVPKVPDARTTQTGSVMAASSLGASGSIPRTWCGSTAVMAMMRRGASC